MDLVRNTVNYFVAVGLDAKVQSGIGNKGNRGLCVPPHSLSRSDPSFRDNGTYG